MGGASAAASILRPSVVDFLEILAPKRGPEIDLEEIRVAERSSLDGTSVGELEDGRDRFRIVAIKHPGDEIVIVPGAETPVAANDVLVVIGEQEALMSLARGAEADASASLPQAPGEAPD